MAININIPIEDAVVDGSLNPVTSNAVFDALADKVNTADLATVATSGDYNDLNNLPTIPAAQVNSDWNATSGVAEILNKPTIPSTSGFVPYTGATNDVNLGVHDLTATQGTFETSGNPDTLTVNHSSGSGKALTITKGGNGEGVYVNKTGGSGNAVTVVGDLEATNLKITGGTSAQFLKANGSIDSTSYQPTLVSGTNIKTINGNSLLGSGDLVISGGGGAIAVGTTAVTSGTVGRVFFQGAGDVVQQDSSLFWDNTNKRLGVGATPATTVRLDVRAQGALSTDIAFRVRNSADNTDLFKHQGNGEWICRNNAGNNFLYWNASGLLQIGTSFSHNCSIQTTLNNSSISTTSNRMVIGSSSHNLDIFKDGNFQFEEASGVVQTSGIGAISLKNAAVIPSANTGDRFMFYSADIIAGNAAPHFRTENGSVIKLYKQDLPTSPTNAELATFLSNLGLANLI